MKILKAYYKSEEFDIKVDDDVYEKYKDLKWRVVKRFLKNSKVVITYPMTTIKNMPISIHQLVLGEVPKDKDVIDHINGDKLDNQIKNLRFCTYQENYLNFAQKSDKEYYGVYWLTDRKKYKASYSGIYLECFDDIVDAAICYDKYLLWKGISQDFCNFSYTESEITEHVLYMTELFNKKKKENREYPKHISLTQYNKYMVQFNRVDLNISKNFDTLEEAIIFRNKVLEEYTAKQEKENLKEIERNEEGIAILKIKNGESDFIVFVDDDKWHELSRISWYMFEYIPTNFSKGSMHRYIWKNWVNKDINVKKVVDHIDKDTYDCTKMLDNRVESMREATHSQNNHNRKKLGKHNFFGVYPVSKRKGYWRGELTFNGKSFYTNNRTDEIQAAIEYNSLATKYYGEFAKLNKIPEEVNEIKYIPHKSEYKYIKKIELKSGKISYNVKIKIKDRINEKETFKTINEAIKYRNDICETMGIINYKNEGESENEEESENE